MGDKKIDMDRVGLFQEMGYVTIGDKYRSLGSLDFNTAASKGKQMLPGGSKERSAQQAGYFAEKFNRIMESEAYSDPIKFRRQNRQKEALRNIGKAFLPSNGDKKPSGLGSFYGTISGPISALSPLVRTGKGYAPPGKNVLTNPGRKGTGYGYIDVGIGDYPRYQHDPIGRAREFLKKEMEAHKGTLKGGAFRLNMHPSDFFDQNPYRTDKPLPPLRKSLSAGAKDIKPFKPSSPAKHHGGMKAGTFDPYPSHSNDPYKGRVILATNVINKSGKIFIPSQCPKTTPQISIVNNMVKRTMNVQNYRAMTLA